MTKRSAEGAEKDSRSDVLSKRSNQDKQIMIVSQNDDHAAELTRRLRQQGYAAFNVSPNADFRPLAGTDPRLILIDCPGSCLPIREFLQRRRDNIDIPVVCLLNKAVHQQVHAFDAPNDSGFLEQAVPFEVVEDRIKQVLALEDGNRSPECAKQPDSAMAPQDRVCPVTEGRCGSIGRIDTTAIAQAPQNATAPVCTVLIVSARKGFGTQIAQLFDREDRIRVIGQFIDELTFVPTLLSLIEPKLLLLDLTSIEGTLDDWLRTIRQADRELKIMLLTHLDAPDFFNETLSYEVFGRLSTLDSTDVLKKAILAVSEGEHWLPRQMLQRALQELTKIHGEQKPEDSWHDDCASMTEREQNIARLVAEGLTNKEIGRQLQISPETVKMHLKHIFNKLGIQRRSQLAAKSNFPR
ncbi:response regulator transcription factor [Methylotuvimicrobium buryatense]|uniref:Helix-turn-helix transcriptional regulator n=1 Tax=Methylotuvimicrobium buryatense TaxID=95641 RepID=A0A4P9US60_METBY|nr:LuxR C-terminal-related transcriptional regulator [Methylotuvimicrobium buryatense]QCW84362.1 helix-turn-helix transcriptional regulator [Methylotuvimicrobium buryatense]